jgi:release factor glutamine methyltransferase
VTVLEGIQRSAEFLARKGIDSPRLQAELLLAHVVKLERMRLYLNFERPLSTEEANAFKGLVIRRGEREPLQQITGSTSFCGFEIAVNRAVLVPRPETELLAEKAWESLNADPQSAKPEGASVLDLGTGSGCLAIAVAKKCAQARVVATDASPEALQCARANVERNSVASRIEFRLGDGFQTLKSGERFDLIVSNPPYIPTAEIETLQPEVRDWEPRLALDGGADGLDWYRRIATEAKAFLARTGSVMVEFGDGQSEAIRNLFESEKWVVEAVIQDYTRRPRIITARRPENWLPERLNASTR